MAKQTFTTGQVLTAAQLTSLQQTAMSGGAASAKTASYTLVAADAGTAISMTSTSATTITVNTGLFAAGDTVFIQNLGTGNLTITAGTATVNTAGSLILPQYDAGLLYFVSASSAVFYDYIQVGATSPLTTKGDLYTFGTSDTRLAVGANGTTLVADSAEATGLKWATSSSGSLTLLSTTALSGASVTVSSINQSYTHLYLVAFGVTNATADGNFRLQPNSSASGCSHTYIQGTTVSATAADTWKWSGDQNNITRSNSSNTFTAIIQNYSNTSIQKNMSSQAMFEAAAGNKQVNVFGTFNSTSAITAIQVRNDSGNLSTGSLLIYGVK